MTPNELKNIWFVVNSYEKQLKAEERLRKQYEVIVDRAVAFYNTCSIDIQDSKFAVRMLDAVRKLRKMNEN